MKGTTKYFFIIGIVLFLLSIVQFFTGSTFDLPGHETIGYSVMPHFPLSLFVLGAGMLILFIRRDGIYLLSTLRGLMIEIMGWILSAGGMIYMILAGFSKYNIN